MNTLFVRILLLIGLGLSLLLMPVGCATAKTNHRTVTGTVTDYHKITIKGSDTLVKRTKNAAEFHVVTAKRGVGVIIGDFDQFIIEANDNVIDYVITEVKNGKLTVSIDDAVNVRNLHVIVKIPNNGKIHTINASSGASVKTEQAVQTESLECQLSSAATLDAALKADRCQIRLSSGAEMRCVADFTTCSIQATSAAELTASVKAQSLKVHQSSGAEVRLTGSCETLEAGLSSGAELHAKQLEVRRSALVNASSGADASVNCAGELTAHASSGADIVYTGDCRVNRQTSSGGSVKKR